MARKFSAKRYLEDREKSTERSRKGELDLLSLGDDATVRVLRLKFMATRHPLNELSDVCVCKTVTGGCELPYIKRTKDVCDGCESKEL